MLDRKLFGLFTGPLEKAGLDYMITGSVASMLYGEPRMTMDIDIVVEIGKETIAILPRVFPAEDYYLPPEEVLLIEANRERRGHFNIIHHQSGFKADIYPVAGDPLHAWGMKNRRKLKSEGDTLQLAPPEYVILRKLEYFREGGSEKHLRDVRYMLEYSGSDIDSREVAHRARGMGLSEIWQRVSQ